MRAVSFYYVLFIYDERSNRDKDEDTQTMGNPDHGHIQNDGKCDGLGFANVQKYDAKCTNCVYICGMRDERHVYF